MRHIASLSALLTIAAITGCGSRRTLSVAPGTHLASPADAPAFTMTVQQPANVQAPAACESTCIGEGYDSSVSLSIVLTSTGYSGPVTLSVSGLPAAVAFVQEPIPPATLTYGQSQTVKVKLYVFPGAAAGSYDFTLSAANGTVSAPVTLSITSAW